MMAMLSPRLWLALALAGMLAFTHFTAYRSGKANVRAAWDAEKLMAQEALRQREKALSIANQGVDREIQAEKSRRLAAERLAADRLRDYQAASDRAGNTTTPGGTDDPHRTIASECAAALEKLDRYAQSVAGTARGLQSYSGKVCLGK